MATGRRYQSDADLRRGPAVLVSLCALLIAVLGLIGCSGLDEREQRTVSGAAIGGAIACWPGAALGAGIGYLSGHGD